MAAPQQREQALRVVGGDRQVALARPLPGEQCRHRLGRAAGDGGGRAVPRRVLGERGERRIATGVDVVARVHERGGRQFVEDDHHHRRVGPRLPRHRLRLLREHQVGDRRDDEEQHQEEQRRGREDREERPRGRGARVERRRPRADEHRERQRDDRRPEDGKDDRGHQDSHEDRLQRRVQVREQREQQRRHHRPHEREEHDVQRGAPAGDEELRLAAQQVEQRLHEGERPEGAQVQRLHARGRASYRVRVARRSVRSTSKHSASSRSNVSRS
jgi:hypothetical protein